MRAATSHSPGAALYLAESGSQCEALLSWRRQSGGCIAGVVFIFDNRLSGTEGLVLLGSIALLFLCGIVWMIFLRDDDDADAGYWPPDARP